MAGNWRPIVFARVLSIVKRQIFSTFSCAALFCLPLLLGTVNWEIFIVKIFSYGLLPYEN